MRSGRSIASGRNRVRPYHDESHAKVALRYLRLCLANYDPPVAGISLRQVRRDKILELFNSSSEAFFELLRGHDELRLHVADLRRSCRLAAILVEMVSLIIETTDLAVHPTEGVVDALSTMIDYAACVAGEAEMRQRDEDISMGERLADLELEELAMPMVHRLSEVHALLQRHRETSPAAIIRGV